MAQRPIILVHGYSDTHKGFKQWRRIVEGWGHPTASVHVGNYVSLSNEVTIKDIAEGFDRALAREASLPEDGEFDVIVHSTGMLVIRAWLASYAEGSRRRGRLKHLIALAPATNGSPLAHQGRSWLGSVFKGSKLPGPDFMEAGDEVLYGLELASRFTWDLAHDDLICDSARFKAGPHTPYVFTFCGNKNYGFFKNLVTEEDGTDGTVRWAGCPLNSRKVTIDLVAPPGTAKKPAITVSEWANQEHPLIFADDLNHATIMSEPSAELQDMVRTALQVESAAQFSKWLKHALTQSEPAAKKVTRWQQFVIRAVDERGDAITDWNAQLQSAGGETESLNNFDLDVHVYKRDPSLRCFHVDLDKLKPELLKKLYLRLIASSGTSLVAYHGIGSERVSPDGTTMNPKGKWDAQVDLSDYVGDKQEFTLFYPFTTTFIEIRLNREPMPMVGKNKVYWFVK